MKVFKRNQIIISVIALMLIAVGYLNFGSAFSKTKQTSAKAEDYEVSQIGDAKLVNSDNTEEVIDDQSELASNTSSNEKEDEETGDNQNNIRQTSTSVSNNVANYFVSSRMERDNMYSEMIETYENILGNASISEEQKNVSSKEISNINGKKNSTMIAENLIKNLGFDDAIIFFNNNSVSVIVRADTLQDADVAQIQNIVCRELNVKPEMVHISVR